MVVILLTYDNMKWHFDVYWCMICQQTTSQEKSIPRVIISFIRTVIVHHLHMLSIQFHLGDIQIAV